MLIFKALRRQYWEIFLAWKVFSSFICFMKSSSPLNEPTIKNNQFFKTAFKYFFNWSGIPIKGNISSDTKGCNFANFANYFYKTLFKKKGFYTKANVWRLYKVDPVLKLDATFHICLDLRACAKNNTRVTRIYIY